MKLKLTELEQHKVDEAYRNLASTLGGIKRRELKPKEAEAMKVLEGSVQNLEAFRLMASHKP